MTGVGAQPDIVEPNAYSLFDPESDKLKILLPPLVHGSQLFFSSPFFEVLFELDVDGLPPRKICFSLLAVGLAGPATAQPGPALAAEHVTELRATTNFVGSFGSSARRLRRGALGSLAT